MKRKPFEESSMLTVEGGHMGQDSNCSFWESNKYYLNAGNLECYFYSLRFEYKS